MTCASPFAAFPSLSWVATRLTASMGSPKSRSAIPPGLTRLGVSCVTAPTTATVTPLTVNGAYSGRAGVVVPFLYTFAPR